MFAGIIVRRLNNTGHPVVGWWHGLEVTRWSRST